MTETKRCTKCGEIKPLTEFHKDVKQRDGHRSWCRSCVKKNGADRRARGARTVGPFICQNCGEGFYLSPSRAKVSALGGTYPPKYCSAECFRAAPTHTQRRGVCGILASHHKDLKDDPDRLSTDFLKSLIGGAASNCEASE